MEASHIQDQNSSEEVRVGIRELRHDFRAWLDQVRAGQVVVVTDRGMPIAELRPHRRGRSWLQRMRDEGLVVEPRRTTRGTAYPVGPPSTLMSDLLREEREGQRF